MYVVASLFGEGTFNCLGRQLHKQGGLFCYGFDLPRKLAVACARSGAAAALVASFIKKPLSFTIVSQN
jgi:hypothetical protein